MDYHSLKRAQLQALCKEHNIPANSTNSVMADKLSELFNIQEKQKPKARQRTCMKSSVEAIDESESAVSRRQTKKVRFSADNDMVEYEIQSDQKEKDMVIGTRHRRKSMAYKDAKPFVDDTRTVDLVDDGVQIPVKLTRSRIQQLGKDVGNVITEMKQGRRAKKDIEKGTDAVTERDGNTGKVTRSKGQNKRAAKAVEEAGESEETVVGRARVTRSKAQTLEVDKGPEINPQVKKKSGRQVAKEVEGVELSKEIMDVPVRVTRSRGQTSKDDTADIVANPQAKKKITRRETKVSDSSDNLSNATSENNQQLPIRKSSRTSGLDITIEDGGEKLGHGKRKKRHEESTADASENQNNANKGSRQSRRNEAKVEDSAVLNHNDSDVEMVNDRKVTRSRALNKKSSEVNDRSKAKNKVEVKQLEEPLQQADGKKVNRRKSVIQSENTDVAVHLEEPVNRPARQGTRRKSVAQKAQGKGIDKPSVGNREMVKEIETVESPNVGTRRSAGKRLSKEQFGNSSTINEGSVDKENVATSEKDSSENEIKAVASPIGSHKSKKRRGNPVIEDQTIEMVYVSSVDASPGHAMGSTSESEEKAVPDNFVAEKPQESSLKSPASNIGRDTSSKRRAMSSGPKQSDLDDHAVTFHTEGATVSNEPDEKVIETERTPAIDESVKRLTRSAIRSEQSELVISKTPGRLTRSGIKHRGDVGSEQFGEVDNKKQTSRSARRRQPLADAQMISPEDTESGAHSGMASSRIEKSISRKRKTSMQTVQETIQADTLGVQSEISEEAKGEKFEHPGELSVSMGLPTIVMEENSGSMSEAAVVMENASLASEEKPSGVESHAIANGPYATARVIGEDAEVACAVNVETSAPGTNFEDLTEYLLSGKQQRPVDLPNFEDEASPGTNLAESTPDAQNQVAANSEKSATFSEAEVQVAVDSEKSVLKSAKPDASGKEMDSARSATRSMSLQTDVMVDEQVVSVGKTVVMEQNDDISSDLLDKGDNDTDTNYYSVSFEAGPQSDAKSKPKEMEASLDPSIVEGVKRFIADDGAYVQIEKGPEHDEDMRSNAQKQLMEEPVSEDNRVHGTIDMSIGGVADGVGAQETDSESDPSGVGAQETDSESDPSANKDACQTSVVDEHDVEHNQDDTLEQSTGNNKVHGTTDMGSRGVADGVGAQETDSESDPSANKDACQTPVVDEHDVEHNQDDTLEQSTGNNRVQGTIDMGSRGVADGIGAQETDSELDSSANKDACQTPVVVELDVEHDVEHNQDDTLEQSTGNIRVHGTIDMGSRGVADGVGAQETDSELDSSTNKDACQTPVVDEHDLEHNQDDTLEQSTGTVMLQDLAVDENDIKDDMVTSPDRLAKKRELSTGENVTDGLDGVDSGKESANEPSTGNDVFQIPILGISDGEDCVNATEGCETDLLPSTVDNMLEEHESISKPSFDNDISDTSLLGKEDDFDMTRQPEPIPEPSTGNDLLKIPSSGNDVDGEGENANNDLKSNLKPPTGDDVMGKDDVEDHGISEDHVEVLASADDVFSECVADNRTYRQDGESEQERQASNDGSAMNEHINMPEELEPCLEPSNAKITVEVPLESYDVSESVGDDKTDGQDGQSEQERLTTKDSPAMDEHTELDPSSTSARITAVEVPVKGFDVGEGVVDAKTDGQDGQPEQERLASKGSPAMDEHTELEPCLESSSAEIVVVKIPVSGSDVSELVVDDKTDGQDGQSEPQQLTGKDSSAMVAHMELEAEINVVKVHVSGFDVSERVKDDNTDGQDGQSEQEQLTSKDSPAMGEHTELEPCSEPSNAKITVVEGPVVDGKTDCHGWQSEPEQVTSHDEHISMPTGLEPSLEPSNAAKVPVSGADVIERYVDDETDGQHGGSELERSTRNDGPAMDDEQDVGGDVAELPQNENIPVVPEVLVRSSVQEAEPVLNVAVDDDPCNAIGQSTSKETLRSPATSGDDVTVRDVEVPDAVSNDFADIDGPGNTIEVMVTEIHTSFCANEQKIIGTSEQRIEEAEMITEIDHETVDHDLDDDTFMEDCSNRGVDESDPQIVGDIEASEYPTEEILPTNEKYQLEDEIGVHESPIIEESLAITYEKEESPVADIYSDPRTSAKDDYRDNQEETQIASTSMDMGNYSFGIDEFRRPVSANESDDDLSKSMKDDQVSDLQTSTRVMEESSSPVVNSATNLENSFGNLGDGKHNQDAYTLKQNANANADVPEEFFSWSEPSMKALFTTPATVRSNHTKNYMEDAGSFSFPDDGCDDGASHDFDDTPHWESEQMGVFTEKTQGSPTHGPEHEMYGVSNFEDFTGGFFNVDVGGGSEMSEKSKHDDVKQNEAGASYNDVTGLREDETKPN